MIMGHGGEEVVSHMGIRYVVKHCNIDTGNKLKQRQR